VTDHPTDPARTRLELAHEFARHIHPALEQVGANYTSGPINGHEWRWSTPAGAWGVTVGGALDSGPLLIGPAENRWLMVEPALHHADLFILMLQLAGALPGRGPAAGLSARTTRPPWQSDSAAAAPAGAEIAGSDLPHRDGSGTDRRPSPRPINPNRGYAGTGRGPGASYAPQPIADQRAALHDRLYGTGTGVTPDNGTGLTVEGSTGPAEYGSDGVAYQGDRIYPDAHGAGYHFAVGTNPPPPAPAGWAVAAYQPDDQGATAHDLGADPYRWYGEQTARPYPGAADQSTEQET
jgi:hypothetical protein